MLAEPRFVFVKDLQLAVGIVRLDLCETLAKFFLNSSCAAGSVWGCCGSGHERLCEPWARNLGCRCTNRFSLGVFQLGNRHADDRGGRIGSGEARRFIPPGLQ